MRELINEALDYLINNYPRVRAVLIEAPTGYGKTYNSYVPFLKFREEGLARGFIYVAPTRALVRQQARDFLSKLQGYSISYQSMDINLEVQVPSIGLMRLEKNPKLSSDVNITTMDSFMFNLMRMPVESLNKPVKWRYMTYRSYIFTSYVFLDEVHLMVEDSSITLASLLLGLHELVLSATPTVIATATLGDNRVRCLALGECGSSKLGAYSSVRDGVRVFRLGNERSKDGIFTTIRDKDWESKSTEQCFQFKQLSNYKEIIDVVKEYGDKVLIITNTVKRAVDVYELISKELGGVALLHGKLDEYDRDVNAEIINDAKVIVGTDAIGVGINPRNVRVLIMDIPHNVDTFIQRVGR
ncbi:DEAD/DEAH box helicase, partial [Caldivirga sp.]|uniref:DEAD/DEAH box helicase n=1 Tax=Caldivirga sp. TaxID=2080243 RepID=UPI0025C23F30